MNKDGIRYGLFTSIIFCGIASMIRDKIDFLANQQDIVFFMVLMTVSFLAFMLVNVLFEVSGVKINHQVNFVVESIGVVSAFAWLYFALKNESTTFPGTGISYFRHFVNGKLYFFLLLIFILIMCVVLKSVCFNNKKRMLLICVMSILMSILLLAPNSFLDGGGGIYHIHAYENSIYNVLQRQPYYLENISIYGHYGLFFYLPVKLLNLFGIDTVAAINIVVFLIGLVSFICAGICINNLIRNDFVFLITLLAFGEISCQTYFDGQYYQLMPHRVLFPMIILAYCSTNIFCETKKREIIGWILCGLAYVWSFESGIICSMTWIYYIGISYLRENTDFLKIIKKIVVELLYFISAIIIPYLLVNCYNLLCGGNWNSFKTYIFPIGSDVYDISALEAKLPTLGNMWFFYVIIALCILLTGFWAVAIKKNKNYNLAIASCVGINSLGAVLYYINRSAIANLSISLFQTVILTGWLLDFLNGYLNNKNQEERNKKLDYYVKEGMALFALVILSIFAIDVFANYGRAIEKRVNSSWKYDEMCDFAKRVDMSLPENVKGIGNGVAELYTEMNREPGIYLTDWSDMNVYTLNKFQQAINSEDKIFINAESADQLDLSGYSLIGEWGYGCFSYRYYSKNANETLTAKFNLNYSRSNI